MTARYDDSAAQHRRVHGLDTAQRDAAETMGSSVRASAKPAAGSPKTWVAYGFLCVTLAGTIAIAGNCNTEERPVGDICVNVETNVADHGEACTSSGLR